MTVQLVSGKHGRFLALDTDRYVGRLMLRDGCYSEEEVEVFTKILRPGDVVVEAGANIGAHTVPMAAMVGPAGRVVAFEPQPMIYRLLCGNLALNDCHHVEAFPVALGNGGSVLVPAVDYEEIGNFGGVVLSPAGGLDDEHRPEGSVAALHLDSFELPALRLLKADVEGMEIQVLLGAQRTIARCRPYLYVEDDREDRSAELQKLITEMGYRMVRHKPVLLAAGDELNPYPEPYVVVSENILCVPEEECS